MWRRPTGRHQRGSAEQLTEHVGVAPARDAGPDRSDTWLRVLLAPLVAVVVALVVAGPDTSYWGEPDQQATVTAAVPDGTVGTGKTWCDAERLTVVGASGRTGHARECADAHAVGDRVTVRWLSPASDAVGIDVWTFPQTLALAAGGTALLGLVVAVDLRVDRERSRRAASPTYRVRRG